MTQRPLAGIRVLDLTRLLPGPYASWLLLGQGASVDVVEPMGHGDSTRWIPPIVDGVGAWFGAMRRGARSIALDFRHRCAPDVLAELVKNVDVVMEGFRPGVFEQLGFDPEALAARGVIVARLSGWGQAGPWRNRPGHDINFVSVSGALAAGAGLDPLPLQVADVLGGSMAAMGVASALVQRTGTGRGAVLDLALSDAALAAVAPMLAMASAQGHPPHPAKELLTGGSDVYRLAPTADGVVAIGALEPRFQAELEKRGGAGRAEVDHTLAGLSRQSVAENWIEACVTPVLSATEAAAFPHHVERGSVVSLDGVSWVRPPLAWEGWASGRIPALGSDTDALLAEASVAPERIAAWRAAKVIA